MLHRKESGSIVAIGQPAHAWVAGQLARAWGNARFGSFRPFENVCLAAAQHDLSMAELDLEPPFNPKTGLPYSFLDLPRETHIALWSRAGRLALSQGRYVALLISLHGTGLYEQTPEARQPGLVREYLARERAFQARLLETLRADLHYAPYAEPEIVEHNRRLIRAWDRLSLALCLNSRAWPLEAPAKYDSVTFTLTPDPEHSLRYTLDPWPFRDAAVDVTCDGRRLSGPYASEEEMRAAYAEAPWVTYVFELRPRG